MSYSVAFSPEALAQLDALEDYISDTGVDRRGVLWRAELRSCFTK